MLLRVVDFETTGFPPDAGIVEIGWTDINFDTAIRGGEPTFDLTVGEWQSEFVDPGKPIEVGAMAIHHITEEDVKGKRKPQQVLGEIEPGVDIFVAHNAKFEQEFFKTPIPWICTYKLALRCVPQAPNHQNQTLRYFLKTPVNKNSCFPPHRAGPDSYVTAHTLGKFMKDLMGELTIEQMIKWSSEPPLFPTCPIGAKYRGKPWGDVDSGFLIWGIKQPDMDEDIKWNFRRELKRRQAPV